MKYFKQIMSGIDVQPLLRQVNAHPELWGHEWTQTKTNPIPTILDELQNIVLRYNKSPAWNKPAFAILNEAQKIILDLMRTIPGEHLGKVIISRLPPGQKINWHVDTWPGPGEPYFQRYQIPLQANTGVFFHAGDEILQMMPGNAYWFNNQARHQVTNDSNTDRISMLADIKPFIV